MREHPVLDRAMADGDVSYAKARVLLSTFESTNAQALVDIASNTPAARLGAAVAAWAQRHDDPETISQRQHSNRRLSWRTRGDGMVEVNALLTPEAAGTLCAPSTPRSPATRSPRAPTSPSSTPTRSSTPSPTGEPSTPRSSCTSPKRAMPWKDGTPLADHTVASLLPDAFVSLLVRDMERQPIDASPRLMVPHTATTACHRRPTIPMRPTRLPRKHLPAVRPHPAVRPARADRRRQPPASLRPPQPCKEPTPHPVT